MLLLFAFSASALHPIILVPGFMRSRLQLSVNSSEPSCPQRLIDEPIWIGPAYLFPKKFKCMLEWMTPILDPSTNLPTTRPNVSVSAPDFGGIDALTGTGPRIFGTRFPPYFRKIIEGLQSQGYAVGKTLFGAPYDWRYGLAQPEAFWSDLKALCEKAVRHAHEKVVFLTHSFGAYLIHNLLSNRTTPEWRRQFIHSVIFSAPSFTGSGEALIGLWRQRIPFVQFYHGPHVANFVGALGGFHIHVPNAEAYKDVPLFIVNGTEFPADRAVDFLIEHNKLTPVQQTIAQANFKFVKTAPMALDVPVRILYNSGKPTAFGLKLDRLDGPGEEIYRDGDGIVGSEGIEFVCEKWRKEGAQIECTDLKGSGWKLHHAMLVLCASSFAKVLQWVKELNGVMPEGVAAAASDSL
jgi:hypothetical protein